MTAKSPTRKELWTTLVGTALLVGGCFVEEDPPLNPGNDGSTTAGTVTSSTDGADTVTPGTTDVDDTAGTTSNDGSTTQAADSDTTADDTTGEPVEPCTCPPSAIICEDFENPLDEREWLFNSSPPGLNPELVRRPVACGSGALGSTAEIDGLFALAQAQIEAGVLGEQTRIQTQAFLSAGCLEASPPPFTRVMELQIHSPVGSVWYVAGVWLAAGVGELRLGNHQGGTLTVPLDSADLDNDEWIDIQLDLELAGTPSAAVFINGVLAGAGDGLPTADTFDLAMADSILNLGPYQGPPFEARCSIVYDDLWLTSE